MKKAGLNLHELVDAYCKEVRSLVELAVPLWHSAITKKQSAQIERIQKSALSIMLDENYTNYEVACTIVQLEPLWSRKENICVKFIKKNMESGAPLLDPYHKPLNTRYKGGKVHEPFCRTTAYQKSCIPFLAHLYNNLS